LSAYSLIIFLVRFLSYNSPTYVSKQGLEYAISDFLSDNHLSEQETREILRLLREKPQFLVDEKCKYFDKIKYYILPFLIK